jgi:threonine synthase
LLRDKVAVSCAAGALPLLSRRGKEPIVRYVSTRGEAPVLGFIDATLAGLARDGGLYVPETWPRLDPAQIAGFSGRPYAEVAVEVIRPFVGGAIPELTLARMAREAYDGFRHPAVVPLVQLAAGTFVLELFHGPTLAFKDLAMQFIARLMDHILHERGERATIVVATSGDTGGAAAEAFRGRGQIDLVALYPQDRISQVQRRMMTTASDDNVHAVAIEGTFDDCQALVKGLFNHHAFRDRVRLSAVNSINWARIVAQVVYYFVAAAALGAPGRKVAFTVPTGNFGDVFAGYVATRMGLPVERLMIATNVNDILVRTLATGAYEPRHVVPTSAPSMDIQVSSNFERLLFDAYGRDASAVRALMGALAQSRRFNIAASPLAAIRTGFSAARADQEETAATIRTVRRETGYLADPHTAVGIAVAEKEGHDRSVPMIVLATAHPAKFPDAVAAACGMRPALPDWLADLPTRPERISVLPPDQATVERFIVGASRAARA